VELGWGIIHLAENAMKKFTPALVSYLLPLMAVVMVSFAYKNAGGSNQLCKHPYALCTSALCVPQPGDPTQAICFCDVEEGPSMSTVPCDSIKPSTDSNGIRTVYSTFSLKQFLDGKQGMKCPEGTPWTWCLNKRCTVDPSNAKRAICVCDVLRKGEWMTLGGNCDTATCQTGYWSGAALSDFDDGVVFLSKALGIKQSPVKWCAAQ
jgi:hypothetical protein